MCYSVLKRCTPEESGTENIYRCLQIAERNDKIPKWKNLKDVNAWNAMTDRVRRAAKRNGW